MVGQAVMGNTHRCRIKDLNSWGQVVFTHLQLLNNLKKGMSFLERDHFHAQLLQQIINDNQDISFFIDDLPAQLVWIMLSILAVTPGPSVGPVCDRHFRLLYIFEKSPPSFFASSASSYSSPSFEIAKWSFSSSSVTPFCRGMLCNVSWRKVVVLELRLIVFVILKVLCKWPSYILFLDPFLVGLCLA